MASSSARSTDARFFLRFSVAIVLIGLVATLTWVKNVNYVRADVLASSAVNSLGRGDFPESLQYIDRSLDLAPDVPIYYRYRAFLYDFSAKETENSDLKLELAQVERKFSENVLDATAAWELHVTEAGQLTGVPESHVARS